MKLVLNILLWVVIFVVGALTGMYVRGCMLRRKQVWAK